MSFLNGVVAEFRRRRLWPVALILLAAIVAVPVLLSRQPATPQVKVPARPPLSGAAVPVLSVSNGVSQTLLTGRERDPFAGSATTATTTAAAGATTTAAASASAPTGGTTTSKLASSANSPASTGVGFATSSASTSGTPSAPSASFSSSGTGGSSGTVSPPLAAPATQPPAPAPPKAPASLGPRQSYHVALSVTDGSGGVTSLDPVKRLSLLPSGAQPLAVELGVLQGGKKVLFAALPGTQPSGDGDCTPSPTDCQIFALARDQVETFSAGSGESQNVVAQLAVAGITVDTHPTAAAGARARRAVSAAGQKELAAANLDALSLFAYRQRLGALLDLSNLTVGN